MDNCSVYWSLIHSHGLRNPYIVCYWLECNEKLAAYFMGCIFWTNYSISSNFDFPFWCIWTVWTLICIYRLSRISCFIFLCSKHWICWYAYSSLLHWYNCDDFYRVSESFFNYCSWHHEWSFYWWLYKIQLCTNLGL